MNEFQWGWLRYLEAIVDELNSNHYDLLLKIEKKLGFSESDEE